MQRRKPGLIRIGVDTGGTFTDLIVMGQPGGWRVLKIRSTPSDPSRAVMEGLRHLGLLTGRDLIIHGTTVATNAFLQGRHGRVALLATRGFEDVLILGRQARSELYRLDAPGESEWIPRELRMGVPERVAPTGEVLEPLDSRWLPKMVRRLRAARIDAVAICLLHSYVNPVHERALASAVRGEGWHVSLSHRIAREFREFERTFTTVANAALAKPMRSYLGRLRRCLGADRLRIMGSSGGWMSPRGAQELPVRTLLSGPAGGVIAAARLGRVTGSPNLITLDMGGTSTDLAVCRGEVPRVARTTLAGKPLLIPALEIHSLGAGGGSIARRDAGGALRVGPESAGADPGPACYGLGGDRPTVTDANLMLGRLPPHGLLGGAMQLDTRAARSALQRLGAQLRLAPDAVARGIIQVVESGIENAIRSLVAGKGLTFPGFSLLVFGGAGGLHACGLARRLGIRRVLVPLDPGAFSALGLAISPAVWEASRTVLLKARAFTSRQIDRLTREMIRNGKLVVERSGADRSGIRVIREADLRYEGQSHELTLPLGADLDGRFHRAHETSFGYSRRGDALELVTVRVRIESLAPPFNWTRSARRQRAAGSEYRQSPGTGRAGARGAPCIPRHSLPEGKQLPGPLLVEEYSATTYVAAGFLLSVGPAGELVLEARG
jgi:N-methylhydantoinase A